MNAAAITASVAAGVIVVFGGAAVTTEPRSTSPGLSRTNEACQSATSGYGAAAQHDLPTCRWGYSPYAQTR